MASRFAVAAERHDAAESRGDRHSARARAGAAPTSPRALSAATGWPVRVLSADEEGRLAYDGAVVTGRGSARGRRRRRRRRRLERDRRGNTAARRGLGAISHDGLAAPDAAFPPRRSTDQAELRAARDAVRKRSGRRRAAATRHGAGDGWQRTSSRKGDRRIFATDDLEEVVRIVARRPARDIAQAFGLRASRAETLAAGAIVLAETARLLEQPFRLARGGLREGAALGLAASAEAAGSVRSR